MASTAPPTDSGEAGDVDPALLAKAVSEPFAVLATHGPSSRIDLVPCCFAVVWSVDGGNEVVSAIDHKPKTTSRLARLRNIEADPAVSFLIDHRDADDWSTLWWVRIQGRATIVTSGASYDRSIDALCTKYPQYRDRRPVGPAICMAVDRVIGWSA